MNFNAAIRFACKFATLAMILGIATGCNKESAPVPSGRITFSVHHLVDGEPLRKHELIYVNAAGNLYKINDLIYFISDITLYRHDGQRYVIHDEKDIFYINDAMPSTMTIAFPDDIEAGSYDSISFIFGISEEKNKSSLFVNPPEVDMAWPAVLGGGYHYMMMNGTWKSQSGSITSYNLHLGIGQLYKGQSTSVDSIYAFVQNYFRVSLPGSAFKMNNGETLVFDLSMHLDSWFNSPHVYDLDYWGGMIMQKQAAMQMIRENGSDVFSIQKAP